MQGEYNLPDNQVYVNLVGIAYFVYVHSAECHTCLGGNIRIADAIIRKAKGQPRRPRSRHYY